MQAKVQFTVVNNGGSAAHITGGWVSLWSFVEPPKLATSRKIEKKSGDEVLIKEITLQPGEDTALQQSLATGATNDIEWANYQAGLRTEPPRYIHLVGMIRYVDDLGIPRRTGIHRTYDPNTGWFAPNQDSEREYTD